MRHLIALCIAALLLTVLPASHAQAQEADTLPTIPYYTSQEGGRQFNVPIPAGWQVDDSHSDYLRMTPTADAETNAIYIMALTPGTETEEAIRRIDDGWTLNRRATSEIIFDGLAWDLSAFDIAEGGNISAFMQARDNATYAVIHVNRNAAVDVYMMGLQPGIGEDAITLDDVMRRLYPDFNAAPDETTDLLLGNATWQWSAFTADEDAFTTLHQQRAGSVYAIIERGGGETVDSVNRAIYTVIFGFFITPDNADFMWAGIIASIAILLLLIGAYYARHRNAEKDLQLIEQLESES
ncbi:MAG: hypothetical protein EA396_06670 [Anaerolineaceae bacterium]|nr:MAG: hypothetical protein EA396_06670 [Anaerolineaceae bacterium]